MMTKTAERPGQAPAPQRLGGYRLRISIPLIEGFLAVYGDSDRYKGDSPADRRQDVRLAWARLGLVQFRNGEVAITARRDSRFDLPSPVGFLEFYERNSTLDSRAFPILMEKLHTALTMFIQKDDCDH